MDLAPFLGPGALTVGLVIAVGWLWRLHLAADADDRAQRDTAIAGWRDQTAATNRVADALEKLVNDLANRHRAADK